MKKSLIILSIMTALVLLLAIHREVTGPHGVVTDKVSHPEWYEPFNVTGPMVYGLHLDDGDRWHTVYVPKWLWNEVEVGDYYW